MQEKKYVVLIVDDSRTTRMMLRQVLEEFNYIVREAENVEKALAIIEHHVPEIILMDLQMPGMDGITGCKKIHKIPGYEHIPIVMITSFDDEESINESFAAGAIDFITKPINWNLLGYRVRYIIRSSIDYKDLQNSREKLLNAQLEVKQLNDDLEKRVNQRTAELNNANRELKITLDSLRKTQNKLLESEKMANIGSLVTTIANEANLPIDTSITTLTNMHAKLVEMTKLFNEDKLKKSDLADFLNTSQTQQHLLEVNLQNASEVIRSFKQVSLDQIMETRRTINLKDYLEEIIFSLQAALKYLSLHTTIECPDDIQIDTYPGVLFQVISILVMNTITHAFEPEQEGTLKISATSKDNNIIIQYADNGKGMPKEILQNIFKPFFTTTRESGDVGLGLHIAYNQITQILNGSITCESELKKGTSFTITFPRVSPEK